ncbi:unnamed protein product [Callosobruchus maculatus]|uniref:Uncharacterized protein n=1 Tax=Callosobruchus maculatus TaxID=64391 RepID=A0A653DWS5_CALMS|nr:unnamed protein product [Callosobruchus maculatus]
MTNVNKIRVVVLGSSRVGKSAKYDSRARSALAQECSDGQQRIACLKKVILFWVPRQIDVPDNERPDGLARLDAGRSCLDSEPMAMLRISRRQVNVALNDWACKELAKGWLERDDCRQTKRFIAGPDKG